METYGMYFLSLVSDDGKPDFYVDSTLSGWWEQTDKSALFLGIIIGIILGIILHILYQWFDRKYDEHLPDNSSEEDKDNKE